MSHILRYLTFMLMILCLQSCATLKGIIKEPVITFKEVSAQDLALTQGTFLVNFDVSNPNAIGLNLNKITYDLQVNQHDFIKNTLPEGIKVPANGNSIMSIPITLRYADLFNSLTEALKSDAIAYHLKGTVGIGPFSIPYQHQGQLPMPKLPEISLQNISIGKLSLDGAALKVRIKLKNPNDFNLKLNGLDYTIALQGKNFASGTAQSLSPLSAKGENLMDLDLAVSFKELGRSALAILKGAGTNYQIKGDILVGKPGEGGQKIPFLQSGQIPLQK